MNLILPLISIMRSALLLCLTAAVAISCNQGAGNSSSAAVPGDTIIIDHTAVELFDSIPPEYLAAAKSRLVWIVGESHSAQIPTGLERLEAADDTYSVQVNTDDLANMNETTALRVYRGHYSEYGWSEYGLGDEGYWATEDGRSTVEATAEQAITTGMPLYLALYCWCWDVAWDNFTHDEDGNMKTFDDERFNAYI